jgi:Aspartyl/Asparaginyl beta-hydroxylase
MATKPPSLDLDRLRLPLYFDPEALAADLATLGQLHWVDHFVPAHYSGNWCALPLRAPAGANHPILQIAANPGVTEWVDTPFLKQSPAFRAAIRKIPSPIFSARLMRLGPKAQIHEHRDAALSPEEGVVRLHIPVTTNDQVDFRLNGARVKMAPGEYWYLRLSDPHSVINAGATDRVHIVVDCAMNHELQTLLDYVELI